MLTPCLLLSLVIYCSIVLSDNERKDGAVNESGMPEDGRVLGGREAVPHSHPYAVYYILDGKYNCTGVIVDPYTIFTKGLSYYANSSYRQIVAGKHSTNKFEITQQIREVCRVNTIFGYTTTPAIFSYSIIQLQEPLRFNNYVQAIPLAPKGFDPIGKNCTFASWGATETGVLPSDVLVEKEITILPNDQCPNKKTANESKICGTPGFGDHDGGGPLVCQHGARLVLLGISAGRRSLLPDENTRFASMPNYPFYFLEEEMEIGLTTCRQTDEE